MNHDIEKALDNLEKRAQDIQHYMNIMSKVKTVNVFSGNLTFFTRLDEMQNGGKYSLRFSKGRKRRIVPTKKL